MKKELIQKFTNKEGIIGIVGLGYVGLPLALSFVKSNFRVIGFDNDSSKIKKLNSGKSYIKQINDKVISQATKKLFTITSNFKLISQVDAIILCLPTPLKKSYKPDLSFIINSLKTIRPYLKKGQVISLESTTYPGTTQEVVLPIIKSSGYEIGKNFFLVYSPEREDPGNKNFNTHNIPKIVSGHSQNCLKVGTSLYRVAIKKVVTTSSTKVAEMTKLLENIYRAVNIGLVNEMKIISDKMKIDIHEVIHAASTKPFGFSPFLPGPGLGGHCIPIDPFYLVWKAKEYGLNAKFIELAGKVNRNIPEWVVTKVISSLRIKKKRIKDALILVLGIAYKKDVDDTRETPAAEIIKLLMKRKSSVIYCDPYIPYFPIMRSYNFNLKSIKLTPKKIKLYDLVLIVTNHSKFDYEMIQKNANLIVDTRGVYKKKLDNVVKA